MNFYTQAAETIIRVNRDNIGYDIKTKNLRYITYGNKPIPTTPALQAKVTPAFVASLPINIGYSGSDPEIFAQTPDGQVVPAWEYLPTESETKEEFVAAYWDGAQSEISVKAGVNCHGVLVRYIQQGLREIHEALVSKFPTATLVCKDVVELPHINSYPGHCVQLGCMPSYNAYDIPAIDIPNPYALPLRFSGVHLHYSAYSSYDDVASWFPIGTVVAMDRVAGLMLCALGRDLEDPRRRQYYGRPGEYRTPKRPNNNHALEYRTPAAWLMHSPQTFSLGLDLGRAAYKLGLVLDGRSLQIPAVESIILNSDADAACRVLKRYHKFFKVVLSTIYGAGRGAATFEYCLAGVRKHKVFSNSVANNWRLDKSVDNHFADWGPSL